jgi:uncharacterized protein (TIGR00255 family)
MIRSMTGYSEVQAEGDGLSLSVTIRTINHRFLDAHVRLPVGLEALEPLVRQLVKDHVARGRVEVAVSLARSGPVQLQVDRSLLAAYAAAYRTLRQEFDSALGPDLIELLRVPGMVMAGAEQLATEDFQRAQQVLERATREALERLNAMRAREGGALERDLRSRLARLEELRKSTVQLSLRAPQAYQQRLESRLRELLSGVELDGVRLAQEVAYLASRADITEELTRFGSHLDQVRQLLEASSEVGKKLDFLLQELNREANTILSKTTDVPEVGLEIARQSIEMKTEIEKLREQAQNIE